MRAASGLETQRLDVHGVRAVADVDAAVRQLNTVARCTPRHLASAERPRL